MVNFAVTDWIGTVTTKEAALAEMEVQLETIDNTKTIILADVQSVGTATWQGHLIYTV